jgi:NAD+ diphosphatase
VTDVVYRSSQPWPFPASLMLGFHCRYDGGAIEARDGELEDVGWFTRADLADGTALLPPRHAIARRLIDEWLDAPRA